MAVKVEDDSILIVKPKQRRRIDKTPNRAGGKPETMDRHKLSRGRTGPDMTTRTIKQNIAQAFIELGGIDGYVAWGRKHPNLFYDHWIKMLPSEIKNEVTVTTDFVSILERARQRALPVEAKEVVGERVIQVGENDDG